MPTRTYYFPPDFQHLEAILRAELNSITEKELANFRSLNLPPIPNVSSIPLFLGISPKVIYSIRKSARNHYRSFEIRKKDGTKRQIDTPRTFLKVIQWWILDNILVNVPVAENIFGFVRGRNIIQNAKFHYGAKHLLNVDIKQFFPSIRIELVQEIFLSLGYKGEVASLLSDLCCLDGRVPQGAPTSPAIANLVLKKLDENLSLLAEESGHLYSRYADDITFSSVARISNEFLVKVQEATEAAKFTLKPEKTRFCGAEGRMEVTGVVINQKLQPALKWRKRARATIHNLGKSERLLRRDLSYLQGIKGLAGQFQDSCQMQSLAKRACELIELKSKTTIGFGENPILPNNLTLKQAEALIALAPRQTYSEISNRLTVTEVAFKRRVEEAFRKIGVSDRDSAFLWAKDNL